MLNDLIQASNTYVNIIKEIEKNDGVITPELELQFDTVVKTMAKKSDQLANTLDYIDVAIGVAKKRKERYGASQKFFTGEKERLRKFALDAITEHGIEFEGEERKVGISIRKDHTWDFSLCDLADIGDEFIKTTKEIKKADLLRAIKDGKFPPKGAVKVYPKPTLTVR